MEEITEFCESYLPYLIDCGFEIIVTNDIFTHMLSDMDPGIYAIVNIKKNIERRIKWLDVKDDMLPFLNIIQKNFKVQPNYIRIVGSNGYKGYLTRAIEDDEDITSMSIRIYK